MINHVGRILGDTVEQARAPAMHPGEAQEVEAGQARDPPRRPWVSAAVEDVSPDPA